ncbi:MAG: class I SAM-dependent methyltransferase [Candidatus Kerfeldbacteria bacterium]|nr:class I SAM-dependent methyltransferase [Candidatus Kerfeldbacteria bacterium]
MNQTPPVPALGKPAEYGELILDRRLLLFHQMGRFGGGSLLDVGCGNGAQTVTFAPLFDQVTGIDVVPEHIQRCTEMFQRLRLSHCRVVQYQGAIIPLADHAVGTVVCIETLEHVADESQTLSEIHRVLKPGGVFMITVPNKCWPFETHGANLPLLPWNRVPFFSWLPPSVHRRFAKARIYTRRGIIRLLASHGFTVDRVAYLTAPLDRIRWRPLRMLLLRSFFSSMSTRMPFLAPSIVVRATRRA